MNVLSNVRFLSKLSMRLLDTSSQVLYSFMESFSFNF
jgi:hypothetical protein